MSDFLNMIHQQAQSLENNGRPTRTEFVRPMKDVLRTNNKTPELVVRLLPNAEWLEGNIGSVGYPFSELWTGVTTPQGKNLSHKLLLTAPARYTETDQRIMNYLKDGRLHRREGDKYEARVQRGAYIYAVQLVQTPTGMVEARDSQGNLDIHLLRLPTTAYTAVVKAVGEALYSPQGNAPFSFMSLDVAFPVKISRSAQGGKITYSVDVFSNITLGALNPEEVKAGYDPNILELTTAYEDSTPELQAYLKDALDLAEKAPVTMGEAVEPTAPQDSPFADMTAKPAFAQSAQPAVPTQAPVPQPTPEINLQPQAPVQQPAQPQVAPTPVAPTPAPQTDNNPFGASMQSMQTPTPVAPQPQVEQPAQPTPAPFGNTATPFSNEKIEGLPDSLQQAVMDAVNRQ